MLRRRVKDLEEQYAREIPVNLAPLIAVYDVRISALEDRLTAMEDERKAELLRRGGMGPNRKARRTAK